MNTNTDTINNNLPINIKQIIQETLKEYLTYENYCWRAVFSDHILYSIQVTHSNFSYPLTLEQINQVASEMGYSITPTPPNLSYQGNLDYIIGDAEWMKENFNNPDYY